MKKIKSTIWAATLSSSIVSGCGKEMTAQDYMNSGISFYEQQDLGRARVQFRNALREDNALAESYYYLSLISEASGDTYVAYADIQRALQLAPANEKIRLKIAEYYVLTGQFEKAIDHVKPVLEGDAAHLGACKVMAASLVGRQDYQEALTVAGRCGGGDPELKALRVIALKFAGDLESATREVGALIDLAPEVQSYRLMALELAQLRGDFEASVSILESLIELSPTDERPVLTLASELSKAGREQEAFDLLKTFNQQNPKNKPIKRVLLEVAEQKGLANLTELLKEFLVQLPDDAGLQLLQVSQLLKGGQSGDAKQLLKQIVEAEPSDKEAYLNAQLLLARLFALENAWQDASERLNALLSKTPYHKEALLLAGTAALNLRDGAQALSYADKLLAREPEHNGAMHIKARALGLMGDITQQKLWYEKIILKEPESLVARDFLVGESIKQRRLVEAKRLLKLWPKAQRGGGEYAMRILQFAMAEEKWLDARNALNRLSAIAPLGWREQLFNAQIFAGEGSLPAAIEAYKTVIELQPGYVAAYDELAAVVDDANLAGVNRWLAEFIVKDPKNIPAVVMRAHLLERSGNSDEAAGLLEKALTSSPEWLQGYKLLAQVYHRQSDLQSALGVYERGLKAAPEDAFLLAGKAMLLEVSGDYAAAADVYELLLKRQPNSLAIKNNYALLLVSYENYKTAARVKKAQALVTEFAALKSPVLQDTYGWVLYHAGDYRGAENVLRLANEQMVGNAEILFHLASALIAQNDPVKRRAAKSYIAQARGRSPDNALIKKLDELEAKITE